MTTTRPSSALAALAGLAALALVSTPALAQGAQASTTAAPQAERIGDWFRRCQDSPADGRRLCVLVQEASSKNAKNDKHRRIMSTVVGRFGKDRRLGVMFTLPLGVRLPPGVVLKVDGNKDVGRLPYQFCNRNGCRVVFLFDDKWLARFKAGLKASVTVLTRTGKEVTVPVSLKGFTKGLRAIDAG